MNLKDMQKQFPGAYADYEKLLADKETILVKTKPLRKQYDAHMKQVQEMEAQGEALIKQIRALEDPALVDIDNRLGALMTSMGGLRLSEGGK